MKKMLLCIDVVSACNLKCPSCPRGTALEPRHTTGIMTPELLGEILSKASRECIIHEVWLFNWTEPLIHPRLAELVEVASSYAPCALSSNLNLTKVDYERLLSKNLKFFCISVSGFSQETYAKSHRGGNIELVKKQMFRLSLAKAKLYVDTPLVLRYHRYLDNLHEESSMRQYAERLGFYFEPIWASLIAVEKCLQYIEDPLRLSEQERVLIGRLAVPPSGQALIAAQRSANHSCLIREEQIVMNSRGEVQLCCGVFDESRFTVATYLDDSLADIQAKKAQQKICMTCMSAGILNLFSNTSDDCDMVARMNVLDYYRRTPGLGEEAFERLALM